MVKQIAKKIGYISSSVFLEIGNSLNLATLVKPSKQLRRTQSDLEAMQKDWEAVGRGVQKSLDRFEEAYGGK